MDGIKKYGTEIILKLVVNRQDFIMRKKHERLQKKDKELLDF